MKTAIPDWMMPVGSSEFARWEKLIRESRFTPVGQELRAKEQNANG